jgi:hypothetical protein
MLIKGNTMPDIPLPIAFRAEVIEPLVAMAKKGESCALVGVGSSGKSNIARHVARADVRLHYFGADVPYVVVLYLYCKPYALRALSDFYLHALDQLGQVIEELDGTFNPLQPTLNDLRLEAQGKPELLAKHNLDKALGQIVRSGAKHIMILLDDCDDLFAKAPPLLFGDLRELRDNHKRAVVYATFTRQEPLFLRTQTPQYEDFFELVSPRGHTIPIPPYNETDGMNMVRRLANRGDSPRSISELEIHRLYDLAGGHAGLIRSLFFATSQGVNVFDDNPAALARLADDADVRDECRKIIDSLQGGERDDLIHLVRQELPSAKGLHNLQQRGLVRTQFRRTEFFSPVFEWFVGQLAGTPTPASLAIDFTGVGFQVRINRVLVDTLSRTEYEILRLLKEKRGQVCSRAELVEAILRSESGRPEAGIHGHPLSRIEQYLHRLRAKIGAAGQYIVPEGDGYRLAA